MHAQCLKITQNVSFEFLKPPIFVHLTCLVTQFVQKLAKTIFGFFDELLYAQNINVARFARNVE